MTERNNRSKYHYPTPEEVKTLRQDQDAIQWRDIWRVALKAAGKKVGEMSAWEVHKMLGITPIVDNVKIDGKPVWGWWRIVTEGTPPEEDGAQK